MSFTELKSRALQLRPAQRAKLIKALVQTIDQGKTVTLQELDRRAEELQSGSVKGIPAAEVFAFVRRRIGG